MLNKECKTIDDVLSSQGVKSFADLNGNMPIDILNSNKITTKGLGTNLKRKAQIHNLAIQYLIIGKRLHNAKIEQYKSDIKSIVGATDYKSIDKYLQGQVSNTLSTENYKHCSRIVHKYLINKYLRLIHNYYSTTDYSGKIENYHSKPSVYTSQGRNNLELDYGIPINFEKSYFYQLLWNPTIIDKYNQKYHTFHGIGDIKSTDAFPLRSDLQAIHKYYTKPYRLTTVKEQYEVTRDTYVNDGLKHIKGSKNLQNSIPRNYDGEPIKNLNTYYLLCSPKFITTYNHYYHTNHKIGELRKNDPRNLKIERQKSRIIDDSLPF